MIKKTIQTYLHEKGMHIQDRGTELITRCVFADCDKDSKGNEAHLYINAKTGQYQCKKCQAEGNMFTLMNHFGDDPKEQNIDGYCQEEILKPAKTTKKKDTLSESDVVKFNQAIPDTIRNYLNQRGISDVIINDRQLGYGTFYRKSWIVIPVRSADNTLLYLKLRRDPAKSDGPKYSFYPTGASAILYGEKNLENNNDFIFICEGEFDQMVLLEKGGYVGITSTGGAGTFKDEWVEKLHNLKEVYTCFDNDDAGRAGAEKLAKKIKVRFPNISVKNIVLPADKGKDISEYFLNGGSAEELITTYCEDTMGVKSGDFPPMYTKEIIEVLSQTIKCDDINKVLVFLACLSAFTDDSQMNILLNAPSSSGKSFIPLQIAQYFPEDSIMELQYVSQNAFFHENGEYNPETNENHIRLTRKIIIFMDQPKSELLARLRPLLSHDKKTLVSKITDKNAKGGNRTKNIVIHGYPVVIFCTASPELDEQEATRFLLLSPETTQEKLQASISSRIEYESNKQEAIARTSMNHDRIQLMQRICYIRDAHIDNVIIEDPVLIHDLILNDKGEQLQPRDQRDVTRIIAIIKAFTLLNFADRRREGNNLYATQRDIEEGIALWKGIGPGQKHGVSPYIMDIYKSVFLPAFIEHNALDKDAPFTPHVIEGIKRQQVCKKHLEVKGRTLSEWKWRQEIEPLLESVGLIHGDKDGRTMLLFPVESITGITQQ